MNDYKDKRATKAISLYNARALFLVNVTKSITMKKFQKLLYAMLNKTKNFGRTLANKNRSNHVTDFFFFFLFSFHHIIGIFFIYA